MPALLIKKRRAMRFSRTKPTNTVSNWDTAQAPIDAINTLFVMISYNNNPRRSLLHTYPLGNITYLTVDLALVKMLCPPLPEVSDYFVVTKVVPVVIEVGYIEFGHEPCNAGYDLVSDFFYLIHCCCRGAGCSDNYFLGTAMAY